MTSNEAKTRTQIHEEAKARMLTLNPGDPVTNICAGEGNPHRHAYFSRLVVKQYKNKYGVTMTDYWARCNQRKGKSWNTDIKAIYPGHLDAETCTKLFHPVWEAEYGQRITQSSTVSEEGKV